jgi:HK97 family phage major capsid protein
MSLFETKKLQEERGEIIAQMREMAEAAKAEGRAFTAEEVEKYDRLDAAQEERQNKINTAERIDKVSGFVPELRGNVKPRAASITVEDRDYAFRAACLNVLGGDMPRDFENAWEKCGRPNANNFSLRLRRDANVEERGQTVGTGSEGGYLQNSSLMPALEKSLKWYGGIRQACRVIRTSTGSDLNWPTLDDTSNTAAIVAENATKATTALTFAQKTLKSYKYGSDVFPVSIELMQDAMVDVASIVGEALGERISRKQNTDYTTGDGSSKPEGLVTAATSGKTADSATAFTWAEVIDLVHSVDIAYRNSPSFGLMMHDTVYAYLKKMEDDNGRPLYLPSLQEGDHLVFNGYKIFINNDMDSTLDADSKLILAGDFSKGIVRDVADVQIAVLRERYADQWAVGFYGHARGDFKLVNTAAVKYLALASA